MCERSISRTLSVTFIFFKESKGPDLELDGVVDGDPGGHPLAVGLDPDAEPLALLVPGARVVAEAGGGAPLLRTGPALVTKHRLDSHLGLDAVL